MCWANLQHAVFVGFACSAAAYGVRCTGGTLKGAACCESDGACEIRRYCWGSVGPPPCIYVTVPEAVQNVFGIERPVPSKWHGFELIAMLNAWDAGNFWNYLAPSLRLFWPDVPVVAILEDTDADRAFAKTLPKGYRVLFTTLFMHLNYRTRGKLHKLYADRFSNAKYIGIIESDALLTTWVTKAALFSENRPRIIGEVGRPKSHWYKPVPETTATILQRPADMNCMSQFPLVYWRSHLASLRAHVEELHGRKFEDLIQDMDDPHPRDSFSEMDLTCNYLLWHHRQNYSFHAQEVTLGWRGPLRPGMANVTLTLRELQKSQSVRLAIHAGYMGYAFTSNDLMDTKCYDAAPLRCRWIPMIALKLLGGFCWSAAALGQVHYDLCYTPEQERKNTLHRDLFRFEFAMELSWGDRPGRMHRDCEAAQAAHYSEIRRVGRGPRELVLHKLLELAGLHRDTLLKMQESDHPLISLARSEAQDELAAAYKIALLSS